VEERPVKPEAAGLYVHFPFCRAKCPCCHFASVPFEGELVALWWEGLAREADLRADPALTIDTIYIGGGTPSLLEPADVRRLLALLAGRFRLVPEEVTLEANPRRSARPFLSGWRESGVTRLSVGVQSFDDRDLVLLGRDSSAAEAVDFCAAARDTSFESLGFDLLVGVPRQSRTALERTVAVVRDLGPDHVSLYLLENVDGLPFEAVTRAFPVGEDDAAAQYEFVAASLGAAGLRRYEISNFARPGRESRHNLKYWRYQPFLGLGPSAASHLGSRRFTNMAGIRDWFELLTRGLEPLAEVVELPADRAWREALVFGLRLSDGVDLLDFRRRFGVDLLEACRREVGELAAEGWLEAGTGRLRIPDDRLLLSNHVLAAFV
jgi:putative oxygen-independent coproporphyrinogen III oxidase